MAGGFVPLPQALQLIGGVPLMKVTSVFAEKLSITKRLDGGVGLQALMARVLSDGNLSSIMQNPMAGLTQGIQGQLGGLAAQLVNVTGASGLVSALTGPSGLGQALNTLQAAGDNLAGLTNGAAGFFSMIAHASTVDMAGLALPAAAGMSTVTAPLTQGSFLAGLAAALPQTVTGVIAGTMTVSDAIAWVQGQIATAASVVTGSAGALAYGAQAHPLIATVSAVAGALVVPPTFDVAGNREDDTASVFQDVLASLVQRDAATIMATSLADQIAHTVHDAVDAAAMTALD